MKRTNRKNQSAASVLREIAQSAATSASGKSRRKKTGAGKKSTISAIVVIAVLALIIYLNEAFWQLDFIPSWSELYDTAGMSGQKHTVVSGDEVSVHFIDVGQGDCALISAGGTFTLIDSGEYTAAEDVIAYLDDLGVERLDMVIASHPHSDHIGSMNSVLDTFGADLVVMPKLTSDMIPTTASYEKLLKSVKSCGASLEYAQVGEIYSLTDECTLEIVAPVKDYDDLNNYSITAVLRHGENSFLFTGDIEKKAERDILDSGADISADVLKVGHHGSRTSGLKAFLQAVNPKYGVISVASPNDYGHPHDETLEMLERLGIEVLRTDQCGNIVFVSDGAQLAVTTEKGTL